MANAVATFSIGTDRSTYVMGDRYCCHGTVVIDASPKTYVTGGLACSLNVPLNKASRTPVKVYVGSKAGYVYTYVPGTDNSNGLLKIFVQDAVAGNPLAEMANALAIPAGVSGDTIDLYAEYNGMN